ncbi:hypothetical protein DM02DRAFT_675778 [Periconia macrospinosa]|uniref:Cora-domain-containing protein n=1 Tax=Periconia macrospinosa TaxID=97972 RepID=A0A2V1DBW3_9PLEO|nr:hypothetical protein DM02DRAFT_675778 [Periconia macrospinosa]
MAHSSSDYSDNESEDSYESEIKYDNKFIFKIDINNAASHQTIHTAKRTTTSNFGGRLTYEQKNLDIIASTLYRDDAEQNLRIITKSKRETGDEKSSTVHERWVHLQTDSIRFEDFERLVINIVLQHRDELVPVVMYLLRKVQDDYETSSAYGSYIEPGTTLRCDGMDRSNRDTPDLSAIFVSLPYLDVGKWRPPNAPKDGSLHLPRGLFQSSYPQEAATDRDGDQLFRNFKGVSPDEYLRIPQLWTLILDSKIIITCGPSHLFSVFEDNIDFVDEESLLSQGPSLVKVTDFQKRVTYLPIERCETFLKLRQSIINAFIGELIMEPDELVIHLGDAEDELKANEWPSILKTQRSAFVYLRLSLKRAQASEESSDDSLDDSNKIEYGALSSDDDDDVGNDMAVIVHPDRRTRDSYNSDHGHTLSKKAETSMRKLSSQGYVVNKTISLETTNNSELERKPKIFQRPSEADLKITAFENTQKSLSSLWEVSEDEDDADDEREAPREESREDRDNDSPVVTVISDSNDDLSDVPASDNQADVDDLDIDGTVDSEVQNEGRSSSELPRATRAETFRPTVESDTEEPPVSSDRYAYLPAENASSPPADINETMDNEKPPSVQSKDGNRESGDHEDTKNTVDSEANDLRQVIKEELASALKKNKDDEQARLEDEMRKRLALFGFQENQIQAMINPEKQHTMPPPPPGMTPNNPMRFTQPFHQPTYAKVHKKYLSVETLMYYDIPWQYDRINPDYIILLQEMDRKETDVLFEHTRRLRALSNSKLHEEESADKRRHYAGLRGSQRSLSKQKSSGTHYEEVALPAKKSSGPIPDRSMPQLYPEPSHRAATVVESISGPSLPPDEKDVKVNLKIPPFLAWPTTIPSESDEITVGAKGAASAPHRNDEELLTQLTLGAITKYMIKLKTDSSEIPVSTHHPFMDTYRSGRAFVNVPELSFISLTGGVTAVASTPKDVPHTALLDIKDEHAFFRKLLRRDTTSDQQPKTREVAAGSDEGKENASASTPRRRAIQWQLAALLSERDSFMSTTQRLIDQFVPNHYPHPLLRKCWGSLDAINEAIMDLCIENESHRKHEISNKSSLIYVIKDIPSPDYLEKNELEELNITIGACFHCSRGGQYADIDDAYTHLHKFHDKKTGMVTAAHRRRLNHWIVSTGGVEMEKKNAEMLKLIQALHHRASRLLIKSIEIRNSVANENDEKDPKYLLPSALVKAAMKVFQFIYTGLYTVRYISDEKKEASAWLSAIEVQDNFALADHYGVAADRQLSKAQDELLLMAHTGSPDGAKIIDYRPSPPEATVQMILLFLCMRKIHNDRSIEELYRNHLSTLRYNAIKNPSKRIFRTLFLLEEELSLLTTLHTTQLATLKTLTHLINPSTYRITTHARIQSFTDLEEPTLAAYTTLHRTVSKSLTTLATQLNKTAQVLRYNLEIAEEGQSKAILVFTIVTIIFLPLSFVAGLFGMNTTDIRDIELDQRIFWAVALPTTAVIGGVSLLVAYGDVGERVERLGKWVKGRGGGRGTTTTMRTGRRRVVEGYNDGRGKERRRARDVEDGEESDEVEMPKRRVTRPPRATVVRVTPVGRQGKRKGGAVR